MRLAVVPVSSHVGSVGSVSSEATHETIEDDVKLARALLRDNGVGLVAVKNGRVVATSQERGVRPLLDMALRRASDLAGAVLGDRVVGRASAMLCVYCRVAAVYTPLASESAVAELSSARIPLVADRRTQSILNRAGTDVCPFERMTEGLRSPAEVVQALRSFFGSGR